MAALAKAVSGSNVPNVVAPLQKRSIRFTTAAKSGQKRLRQFFSVTAASQKAQLVQVICEKKQKRCQSEEREVGDCWIGISLARESGLIISARVGKHTDDFLRELVTSTEGKTDAKLWFTDNWVGYERVLPPEVKHLVGKENTQGLERTNGITRQQTGRWHRRQNKFGKQWAQTKVTARLVVRYFNWIWRHSRTRDTADQRAGLAAQAWS